MGLTHARWEAKPLEEGARSLARSREIPLLIAHLLWHRGLREAEELDAFLRPTLQQMPDPATLTDAPRAARRILDALATDETVMIYGDYDADGITSAALLTLFFRRCFKVEPKVYLPQRLRDGYGLSVAAVERVAAEGVKLLLTVDNGSSAIEAAARARELGIDLIIIDHHQVSDPEPAAFAHLNPNRPSCAFREKGLAAVGVAFMLLVELRRQLDEDQRFSLPRPALQELLDIVSLGTVVDVAPMRGLNRALTVAGLKQLRETRWPGLRALCAETGVHPHAVNGRALGFKLGPPINASGRLGDPGLGYRLLCAEAPEEAARYARELMEKNKHRRTLQDALLEEVMPLAEAEAAAGRSAIVLADESWHQGIVGIVAGRLADQFLRPAFLLGGSAEEGLLKGSARGGSAGLNLKRCLDRCAEHLTSHGGHREAAGLGLYRGSFEAFRERLDEVVREELAEAAGQVLEVDAEVSPAHLDWSVFDGLEQLMSPFGAQNPSPRFLCRGVHGALSTFSEGRHLRLRFARGSAPLRESVWWGHGELISSLGGGPYDLIGSLEQREWRGERWLQLRLDALRPHTPGAQ